MAFSPDMLQEYFEQAQKCKISWKIQKIQKNIVSYNLSIVCYALNMCPQGMYTVRRTG